MINIKDPTWHAVAFNFGVLIPPTVTKICGGNPDWKFAFAMMLGVCVITSFQSVVFGKFE